MQTTPILLASALLVATACRSAATNTAEVQDLVARQQAAWNAGDVERFLRLGYWDSPELTFFSGGDVVSGFDTMLQRFLKRYKHGNAESGELTFADVVVTPLGSDHAFARGHWYVDFQKAEDQGGLFTLVLERQRDGWRIVHDHTSLETPKTGKVQ
ncbi:MAG: nuclear transport factor 2 family protein [Planctomycetes bacterium]|nr:nuclear transport factor 2 family protein [Planctomycetota bacterium]